MGRAMIYTPEFYYRCFLQEPKTKNASDTDEPLSSFMTRAVPDATIKGVVEGVNMRIKRIEINGFKSFADKTEVDMGDGLTAVVGPNGAGKSNLAEAVKWVLGEQSARILRGTRMDDVIFSGTAKRKSVGFAEVSLIFDNTQGLLPIDFSEVVISRRVYRSGDGEYYINRKLCRLKDITELFLDTGIGKDSYSFVGQGRIEEILSADPRERRAIFEEAAGISRYKLRKRETENRLNETEHNLRRVLDIASELENLLAPLSGEADRAREYLSLGEQRRVWEKELLLYEVGLAERQSASLKTQIERTSDELIQQENTMTITENKRTMVSLAETSALTEIQDLEKNVYEIKLLRQQRQERLTDVNLELDKLRLQAQGFRNRIVQHQQDIENVEANLRQLTSEYDLRAEHLKKVQAFLAGLPTAIATEGEAEEDSVSRLLLSTERSLNDLRAESLILEKRLNSLYEDISVKQRDQVARVQALDKLKTEESVFSQHLEELGTSAARLQEQKRFESLRLATLREQHTKLSEQTHKLQAGLFQAQNRLRALKSAEAQMEGLGRGARFVLGLNLSGVLGVVGNLVSTSQEFETAIEVALGAAVGDVVTDCEATAKLAISKLKERGQGRATFYPLETVRPRALREVQPQLRERAGFKGRAVDLVSVDNRLVPVIQQLLGNVLIVDSLDTASWVAKHTDFTWRIVTLDGDVSMPGGSVTGGSKPERQAWMLSRRREVDEAEVAVATLATDRMSAEQGLQSLYLHLREVEQSEKTFQQQIDDLGPSLTERRQQLVQVSGRLTYLLGEQRIAQQSITSLQQEIDQRVQEQTSLEPRLLVAAGLLEKLRKQVQELEAKEVQRRKEIERTNSQRTELYLEQAGLVSEINAQERVVAERRRQLVEAEQRHKETCGELANVEQIIAQCQQRIAALDSEILGLVDREATGYRQLDVKKAERIKLQQEQREIVGRIERLRNDANVTNQKLHNLELRVERIKAEQEFLQQRLEQNFGEGAQVPSKLSSRGEAEEEISRLDTQIVALGAVRVSAISEYERLQERVEFLSKEQTDLRDAAQELNDVIAELDKVMGERFLGGFSLVRKAFSDVAGRLFGGAVARLSLTNPEAPLESGIEIDVQPPGKRLQNLNLLSGGERAMAAIALLCAVLKVKPTPFCILDEIDAPLDDANVERLIPVLKELCATTQFLLITHTKGTMMASDTLYGVTMPEQGVSKVLAVKVSEIANV